MALAKTIGAEIVNADSMQIYADLEVLTARPAAADLAAAPHHLYGVADGGKAWSAGRWLRAAEVALGEIAGRGRRVIVVGGTGLYFRALTQGLADIPPVSDTVRDAVEARYLEEGEVAIREALRAVDPAAATRIEVGDRQRLVRALSVHAATGRALSDWHGEGSAPLLVRWRGLVLDPPREQLYASCDARLGGMIERGALEEVRGLMARNLSPDLPVMKALGVPEFAAHLRGELTVEEALAAARQSTRRYAKRQTTWFRNQTPDWPRLAAPDFDTALAKLGA